MYVSFQCTEVYIFTPFIQRHLLEMVWNVSCFIILLRKDAHFHVIGHGHHIACGFCASCPVPVSLTVQRSVERYQNICCMWLWGIVSGKIRSVILVFLIIHHKETVTSCHATLWVNVNFLMMFMFWEFMYPLRWNQASLWNRVGVHTPWRFKLGHS